MHTNLRHQRVLQTLLANRRRSLDLDPTAQQTRLSVYLMTRERTIAAPDAQVHVHDKDVRPVDDSRCDFFFGGFECVQIWKRFDREWQRAAGGGEWRKGRCQLFAKLRIG